MTDDAENALRRLLHLLNKGREPKDAWEPEESLEPHYEALRDDIKEVQGHLRELSAGRITGDIRTTGYTAGLLKNLQANLLHVTWQAKRISEGDLSQRVDFLDEFSESFNSMAAALQANRKELEARQEQLIGLNERLSSEVEERRKAQESLALANHKLMILSSITRHDTLNQLTAARGYLELQSSLVTEDERASRYNDKAISSMDNIADLIEFGKEYEKVGLEGPRWAAVSSMLENLGSGLIDLEEDCDGLEVYADPMMDKVFYNLMDNAERHATGATLIRVSHRMDDGILEIIWEDDGPGIAESDKERVFERGVGRNTGFGLFLIREILQMTGLTVREDGKEGSGARFVITVPDGKHRLKPSPCSDMI